MIVAITSLRPSCNNADEWHFTVGENQCWHLDTRLDRLWCNCVDTLAAAVPQFPAKMTTSFLMMWMSSLHLVWQYFCSSWTDFFLLSPPPSPRLYPTRTEFWGSHTVLFPVHWKAVKKVCPVKRRPPRIKRRVACSRAQRKYARPRCKCWYFRLPSTRGTLTARKLRRRWLMTW